MYSIIPSKKFTGPVLEPGTDVLTFELQGQTGQAFSTKMEFDVKGMK